MKNASLVQAVCLVTVCLSVWLAVLVGGQKTHFKMVKKIGWIIKQELVSA